MTALVLAVSVLLAGCGDKKPATETGNYGYPTDTPRVNEEGELLPPPVQIGGGSDSRKKVSKDTVVTISSQSEFEKLQKAISGGNEMSLPGADFSSRQMLAVFLKPKNDGANAQVVSMRKSEGGVVVNAQRTLPGEGCPGQKRKTYPYIIVETEKTGGTAKLNVERSRRPPC